MKQCCKKTLRRYREAIDLVRCETIRRDNDYQFSNRIEWVQEKASIITKNWRAGKIGRKAWEHLLPFLSRALRGEKDELP